MVQYKQHFVNNQWTREKRRFGRSPYLRCAYEQIMPQKLAVKYFTSRHERLDQKPK